MSKSSKSRLYTAIGWAVFTIAKRTAKKRVAKVAPGGSAGGGKGKKLLVAGAVAALVGGTAFAVSSSGGDQA